MTEQVRRSRRARPVTFTHFEGVDTPLDGSEYDPYSLFCPQCRDETYGLHVVAARIGPHGDRGRPAAQIALECEGGCVSTLVFGNHKGSGYCFWTEGARWASAVVSDEADEDYDPDGEPGFDESDDYDYGESCDSPRPETGYEHSGPAPGLPILVASLVTPVLTPEEQEAILRELEPGA